MTCDVVCVCLRKGNANVIAIMFAHDQNIHFSMRAACAALALFASRAGAQLVTRSDARNDVSLGNEMYSTHAFLIFFCFFGYVWSAPLQVFI